MDETRAREALEQRRRELEQMAEDVHREAGLDEQQGDASSETSTADQELATDTLERERAISMENDAEGHIGEIDAALERLDEGTYGRCEACGEPIDDERLKIRPETRYCVEHQPA